MSVLIASIDHFDLVFHGIWREINTKNPISNILSKLWSFIVALYFWCGGCEGFIFCWGRYIGIRHDMICSVPPLFICRANQNKGDCSQGVNGCRYPEHNLDNNVTFNTFYWHIDCVGLPSGHLPVFEVIIATNDLTNNQWSNKSEIQGNEDEMQHCMWQCGIDNLLS